MLLTFPLYGGEWSASRSGHFTAVAEATGTRLIGEWMVPRAGFDTVAKRKKPRHSSSDTILAELPLPYIVFRGPYSRHQQ